jgi:hypothetical protein
MEITEGENVSPMDTDDESTSGMDAAEDGKIGCNGSPIINFIGAVYFPVLITSHVCTENGKVLSLRQSALQLISILAPSMLLTTESMQ